MDGPLYVYFGAWVNARRWAVNEGLREDADLIVASDPHSPRKIREATRQLVFVRDGSTSPDIGLWRDAAKVGRERNEENGYGATEVVNV